MMAAYPPVFGAVASYLTQSHVLETVSAVYVIASLGQDPRPSTDEKVTAMSVNGCPADAVTSRDYEHRITIHRRPVCERS